MVVRTALMDKRAGMTIITWLSRSLAIMLDTISVGSMVVRTALMDKRTGMTIITWLSRSLAISIISMSISISTIVSMESLWTSMCITDSMTIAISSISRPLAIAIVSMVSSKTLCSSICVTMASIWMVCSTIARLCSGKAGEGQDNSYNFNCHGYKCTKL